MTRAQRTASPWRVASFVIPCLLLGLSATEAAAQGSVEFLPRANFATGTQPNAVAIGDLNNDGLLDMVVANGASNSVSVLLGSGITGFAPRTDVPAGVSPHGVAIGDMNGDGKPDLVVVNSISSTVWIIPGTGTGTFGPATQIPAGTGPFAVAVADLNADGKLDLAIPNSAAGTVSVMLGDGAGGIASRTDFATGAGPTHVAIRDFNGDGNADLATTNEGSNSVSVLLGSGDGNFGPRTDFATGNTPRSVGVGDFNGDAHPDLAVTNYASNTVSILLGNGLGGFGSRADFGSGATPRGLAVGDLNADGNLDLVVADERTNSMSLLGGTGAGTFVPMMSLVAGAGPYAAAIADLNGDGFPDLVNTNFGSGTVSVYLQVPPRSGSNCALTSSPNPSSFGAAVVLTAAVTPGVATGIVTFHDGSTSFGTVSLVSGSATLTVSGLATGVHTLTAVYGGDIGYSPSTSPAVSHTVTRVATTLALGSSLNPALFSEAVTFTATLSDSAPGAGHPTGSVQFKIDDINTGPPVAIDAAGLAHATTSALAVGDHAVGAVYGGDANFSGSASAVLNQTVGSPSPVIDAVRDVASDQGGRVFLTWHSPLDKPGARVVTGYHVWRRAPNPGTAALRGATAGELEARDEPSQARVIGTVHPDGIALEGYWEPVATLPAEQLIGYAYEAATTQDSVAEGNPYTAFFVTALTSDPFIFFQSVQDSGYSVDNLPPPMPVPFAALYLQGSTALHWVVSPAADFREFRLYRGLSPEFVPGPSNLVIATRDTGYVDIGPTPYVYKLAATDVHGNPSRYAVVTPNGPVATLASLIAVDAQPDRIRLTWYAAGNPGLLATVYRRTANTAWISLGLIATDGTGYLRYEDTGVQIGTRYNYRLGIMDGGTEVFVGEAWATAERLVFELDGARPNPAVAGQLTVYFSLPSAGAAKLELIDVGGRRLALREVGSLGAGRHSVRLSEGGRIPPGIYLARLTQGGNGLTRRVTVLP